MSLAFSDEPLKEDPEVRGGKYERNALLLSIKKPR